MKTQSNYYVIVIGCGSMGAATAMHLADRGCRALALEQFDIPHEHGSHTGQSRIIRQAYFEHPDYVPLLLRAYANWAALEARTGAQVYFETGILYCGYPGEEVLEGARFANRLHRLSCREMSREELRLRYPQVRLPEDYEVFFEEKGGFLTPERAIALYVEEAIRAGASIHAREQVMGWEKDGGGFLVKTDRGTYHSERLIFTAGAWTGKLLKDLGVPLTVTRQLLAWVSPQKMEDFSFGNFPVWFISDRERGRFYGFPALPATKFPGPPGFKLALHQHGQAIDPEQLVRHHKPEEEADLRYCLEKFLPAANGDFLSLKTCLYTNSPDEHFIIDHLPGYDGKVTIACGFSGHGFKFASVLGEVLADLAMEGETDQPIEFLKLNRFHLT